MRQFLDALPVRIAFGRPSRADAGCPGRCPAAPGGRRGPWLAGLVLQARSARPRFSGANAELEVSSSAPSGASLLVDDQPRGLVPTMVALAPGAHTVTRSGARRHSRDAPGRGHLRPARGST